MTYTVELKNRGWTVCKTGPSGIQIEVTMVASREAGERWIAEHGAPRQDT